MSEVARLMPRTAGAVDRPKTPKHTPGPWQASGVRISGESLTRERLLQVVAPSGALAFVIYSDRTPADHVQAHADQRLIAAALDMKDQLADTLHTLGLMADAFPLGSATRNTLEEECVGIRVALAKAGA